jgi:signal transduction histidine kinase/ActR/RegA family two-component response regulator
LGQTVGVVSTLWHHDYLVSKRELRFLDLLARQAADLIEQQQSEIERQELLVRERSAREEAEQANRVKDEFLSILSHELRSPLNPILGWANLLQTRKFDETRLNKALATIERSARVQAQLIDDLLDVARILRGKMNLQSSLINLSEIIDAALETVQSTATAKSISLQAEALPTGQVSGDPVRLQQIVWNLLSNAVKFTPQGGQVTIQLEPVGNQAQITVSDTGKGISPDFLPHIFESFRQQDASITRQFGGLGLGLAIVRYLVEAHGGTITADSPGEGQGATFRLRFPLVQVEPEKSSTTEQQDSELDLTGIQVLVVDDELEARELLGAVLTIYGAQVRTATSATETLTLLETFQPDVLVSDISMPNMDGYALIQRIRALPAEAGGNVSAIALTAYAKEEDQQRALESGYQVHLTKPLEPKELVQAVVNLAHRQ